MELEHGIFCEDCGDDRKARVAIDAGDLSGDSYWGVEGSITVAIICECGHTAFKKEFDCTEDTEYIKND
jgi:hypothetical protein